jgi:hypothetical protein
MVPEVRDPVPPWIADLRTAATLTQLEAIVADVGRLRRFVDLGDYDGHLVERISGRLEVLLQLYLPTAAELIRDGKDVDEAIAAVDRRAHELRRKLGALTKEERQ